MGAKRLDGKALGLRIEAQLAERVAALKDAGVVPHLAVVLAGNDPASHVYVRNKQRACERCGIKSTLIDLPNDVSQDQLDTTFISKALSWSDLLIEINFCMCIFQ